VCFFLEDSFCFLAIYFAYKRTRRQVEDSESLPGGTPEIEEKPFQETVISFIDNHIDSVTVESLLDHFGMIKKDFYKEFKIHFEQTPGQLIRDKRKEKVIQALQTNPDTDITKLAKEVGYSERHIQNILNSKDFSKLLEGRA
jgi:AraC-like DNA-binding protein